MPQDGLRSAIYRSFVTCDDPKGVVNCRTIRKSKTNSPKMDHHKSESQRKLKSLSTTSLNYEPEVEETMASKGFSDEIHSPASFQLMEVSKGAKKLNHTIDSWSKGLRFEGQSNDIAKDLLKGALDLQDSLVMLGKLQEASQYMAHLKKKQIKESERGGEDEPWIRRTSSDHQFRDIFSVTGYQKPRLSVDGTSRNSTEELKKVIRESLVSQNLLPKARKHHERAYDFPQRNMDSASTSESPSTTSSTSQSSLFRLTTDSPTASTSVAPQMTKGPSLIAKLMGLEECPLKPLQATPQNQFEGQKVPNQIRPIFDIDMPKGKKPQYGVQKVDPERRRLKEILESMQYKGLLRSNSARELQPRLDDINVSSSKQRLTDDGQPIVLMKPLRVPFLEPKETNRPVFEEEDPLYRRKMLRKLRRKEELHPKDINYKEGTLKPDRIRGRPKAEETTSQGLKQEAAKEKRVVSEIPVEKEVVVKENSSVKSKASHSTNHKQQRNEAIVKEVDKMQNKVTTVSRKSLEKDVKTKSVLKPEDQAKKTSIKAGKQESALNIPKNQISRLQITKPSTIKHAEQSAACNSIYQKRNRLKKDKPLKKPTAATTVVSLPQN